MNRRRGFINLWIIVFLVILIAGGSSAFYFYNKNYKKEKISTNPTIAPESDEYWQWQTYQNDEYNYTIKYPQNWYKKLQGYAPPPPAGMMFATKPDSDSSYPYASVEILSIVNPDIDDIANHPEVKDLASKGEELSSTSISSFSAVKLTGEDTISHRTSYYVKGNDDIVYRIGFQYPVT